MEYEICVLHKDDKTLFIHINSEYLTVECNLTPFI